MAKIESRLPFLRSSKPKVYHERVYIIARDDQKLSDFSTDVEPAKTISKQDPIKNGKSNIAKRSGSLLTVPASAVKGTAALSAQRPLTNECQEQKTTATSKTSHVKRPSQLRPPTSVSVTNKSKTTHIAEPAPSVTCSISQHASNSTSSLDNNSSSKYSLKHAKDPIEKSGSCLTPSSQRTTDSRSKSLPSHHQSPSFTISYSPSKTMKITPSISPKSSIATSKTKISSPPQTSTNQSCSRSPPSSQQSCNYSSNNPSVSSKVRSRLTKPFGFKHQPLTSSSVLPNCDAKTPVFSICNSQSQTTTCQISPDSQNSITASNEHFFADQETPILFNAEKTTPTGNTEIDVAVTKTAPKAQSLQQNLNKHTSQHCKSPSRLVMPTKMSRTLKKPATLTSKTVPFESICEGDLQSLSISLERATIVQPINLTTNISANKYECLEETRQCCLHQTTLSHAATATDLVTLHTASPLPPTSILLPTSTKVSSELLNTCTENIVQSSCKPFQLPNNVDDIDEVFVTENLAADAKVSQCYSYLQQAATSSYHKHHVNSFTIKEKLSPTAECHAQHIATSIPSPWLSADLIKDAISSQPHKLLIPEPLKGTPNINRPKLHSIFEGIEPTTESSDLTPTSIPAVSESSTDKDETKSKSPSPLVNFFSKIGGRRILARPQESPPRVRRSVSRTEPGLASSTNRRKLSPKTRRKDGRTIRHIPQAEQQASPKHKPLLRDDSPIRSKEPYYGGVHHHMPRPASEEPPCSGSIVLAPGKREEKIGSEQLCSSKGGSLKRCDTPTRELSTLCREDHMRFYKSSGAKATATLPQRTRPRQNTSSTTSEMNSIPITTRSLSHKKKQKGGADNGMRFKTNYSSALRMGLPPCPQLTGAVLEQGSSALSKVTVAVRLKQQTDVTAANAASSYVTADSGRGQLILRDPSNESNMAPSCRRQLAAVPKFFAFDTVFGADAMQMLVCKDTVLGILQAVLQGSDGCVISFGQSKTGKSRSLIGDDSSCADFGIIPTAISWLYQMIEEQKTKTGARFSVRISALEIRGKDEELTDLLAHCNAGDTSQTEQVQLTSTDVYGAQVENLNELRAPDVDHAGHHLDATLTSLLNSSEKSESKGAHLLFTLHIYQHHVESRPSPGGALVAGGRSRLHFIDIGPCAKSSSDGSALTLAALGSVITALLNGQRQFPHKESKLATLLKDSVGNQNCRTCILVHISTQPSQYAETVQILQLAARVHRMKVRRRNKISSNSSDDTGSANSNMRRRRGIRMGTSASLSDPDVSSSEQSIDTVIYVPGARRRHQQSSNLNPPRSVPQSPNPEVIGQHPKTGLCSTQSPPYKTAGAIKTRLSDDETSSEGRRRMPRTNARAWPRTTHTDNEIWLDTPPPPTSRDQWHIPGNANPTIIPHTNNTWQHVHQGSSAIQPQSPYQHNSYQPQHTHMNHQNPPWLSLAQYNGHPEQIAQLTTPGASQSPSRQAWIDNTDATANGAHIEVSKQELWVDGPTAFRKNIEGLTNNLHRESVSPVKKHQRHHTPNHGERGEKHKLHRSPSKKHRDATKHCHQCGADIKKELKTTSNSSKVEQKTTDSKQIEEPSVTVKPFVKDWVLRHSQNNTPTKSLDRPEASDFQQSPTGPALSQADRAKLLDEESLIQDDLQLTVDLEEELANLPNLPCADDVITDNFEMERQDEVHIDDSVSNVTADEKVGFESKEGSSFDENSLAEEVVEVCDAACQTEFTDSDSVSVQSSGLKEFSTESITVRATLNAGNRSKRESTEAFLNATIQGAMLRKPDGASDPSIHKELTSPTERKISDTHLQPTSSTLPRNVFLKSPKPTANAPASDKQTIKLQPYLSSPKPSSNDPSSASLNASPKVGVKLATAIPGDVNSKPESKMKKLGLFRQSSHDSKDSASSEKQSASTKIKKKGSMLPGLRLSSKSKEGKPSSGSPSSLAKKSDSIKKEKKSLLQTPTKVKGGSHDPVKQSSRLAYSKAPSNLACLPSSPYRQYVLPKPSYSHSDVYSANSSCPSHSLANNKHSVSSGYDSMTMNSADDIFQPGLNGKESQKSQHDPSADMNSQSESRSMQQGADESEVKSCHCQIM